MGRSRDEMPSDLWCWSATSLRDAVRRGDVSATEVVTAHLDRCQEVNGSINALVSTSPEEALATAKELDERPLADRSALLYGVPVCLRSSVTLFVRERALSPIASPRVVERLHRGRQPTGSVIVSD